MQLCLRSLDPAALQPAAPCPAARCLAHFCPTARSPRPNSSGHATAALPQRPYSSGPPVAPLSAPQRKPQRPSRSGLPTAALPQRPCSCGRRATTLQQRPCNGGPPAAVLLVTRYNEHQCAQGLRGIQIRLTTRVQGSYFKQAIRVMKCGIGWIGRSTRGLCI